MRQRKQHNQILSATELYLQEHLPELAHERPQLRALDGPPDSPRYAVAIEICPADSCPRGYSTAEQCSVLDCPLRRSVRLLLGRGGEVMHVTQSGIHWS